MAKVFSKRAWLECANAKKEKGILTEIVITFLFSFIHTDQAAEIFCIK